MVGQRFWGGLCVSHGQIGECRRIREVDSFGGTVRWFCWIFKTRFSFCGFCLLRPAAGSSAAKMKY